MSKKTPQAEILAAAEDNRSKRQQLKKQLAEIYNPAPC